MYIYYIYIYTHIYIYMYLYMYIYEYTRTYIYIRTIIHVHIYDMRISICLHIYINNICIHKNVRIHMCIYIYKYICIDSYMSSGLLPLVFICFPHPWHYLLLNLGFSTKLHLHCLHLTRLCGLCHHPPLSNSGNVSGHHLAVSNKTSCWSSSVSFVANFSSVQFCHPCHLSSYSRWLCPLIWTWNSTMLSSPSPTSRGLINHSAFFTDSTKRPPTFCVFTSKRAPSGIHLGATWWSLLMIVLTSAFRCVVCSLINLPSSACARVRKVGWFKATFVGWIKHLSCHTFYPHLWIFFVKTLSKVSVDMTTNPTCCPLLALFVQTLLCSHLFLLDLDFVSCAWLVTILLEAALHQVLRVLSWDVSSLSTLRLSVQFFSNYSLPPLGWQQLESLPILHFKVLLLKLLLFLWRSLRYRNQRLNSLLAVWRCTYPHCQWYHR